MKAYISKLFEYAAIISAAYFPAKLAVYDIGLSLSAMFILIYIGMIIKKVNQSGASFRHP